MRHDVAALPHAGEPPGVLGRLPVGLGDLVAEVPAELRRVQAQQAEAHAVAVSPETPSRRAASRAVAAIRAASAARLSRPAAVRQ